MRSQRTARQSWPTEVVVLACPPDEELDVPLYRSGATLYAVELPYTLHLLPAGMRLQLHNPRTRQPEEMRVVQARLVSAEWVAEFPNSWSRTLRWTRRVDT